MARRLAPALFFSLACAAVASGCAGGGGGDGGSASPAPSVSTTSLPPASLGVPYAEEVAASGGSAPYSWSVADPSALPPGIALAASVTAERAPLLGTPLAAGTFTFRVRVADAGRRSDARDLTISVATATAIVTAALADARRGVPYAATIASSGGVPPYAWSVVDPAAVPAGLTLSASSGAAAVLSGTPLASGRSRLSIEVRDADGRAAKRALEIVVKDAPRALFTGDVADIQFTELFSVLLDGTAAPLERVNDSILPTGGDVTAFAPSPDGTRAAYVADADQDEVRELYVVELEGPRAGISTKLSAFGASSEPDVLGLSWSPDSRWIAYRADADVDGRFEVYVVDARGGPPRKAHPDGPTPDGAGETYAFSTGSRFLAARAEPVAGRIDLYVTDLDAPAAPPRLANPSPVAPSSDVKSFLWTGPAALVMIGDQETQGRDDAFAVTIAAGLPQPPVKLATLLASEDVSPSLARGAGTTLSPDGTLVAFRALATDADRVFVSALAGGVPGPAVAVSSLADTDGYEWRPDSKALLLDLTVGIQHLQLVELAGATPGPARGLTTAALASGTGPEGRFGFTPDGAQAWFRSSQGGLYVVSASAQPGAPQRLDPPPPANGGPGVTGGVVFTPDSRGVAFMTRVASSRTELYATPLRPSVGAPARVTPVPVFGGGSVLGPVVMVPGTTLVLYRGDVAKENQPALYVADIAGGAPAAPVALTPGLSPSMKGVGEVVIGD